MGRIFRWSLAVVLLTAASGVVSAPVTGARATRVRIGRQSSMTLEEKFLGGQRACVIAVGDHNPPVDLGITVFDEAEQLVAEDQSRDFVAAIWYPPRTAKYKILVKNTGVEYNDVRLVFK
jgi:hypothetical protein